MWLHILKKDIKLHWPFIAAVMALKGLAAWMILKLGIFAEPPMLVLLLVLIQVAFPAVAGLAIIVVVQTDSVVSTNNDCLIRPIRRSDLVIDKIAFAALVTLLPTFTFNLGIGMIHGLDALPAIEASVYTAFTMFIGVGLPALALGTITARWSHTAGIAFVIFIIWIAISIMENGRTGDFENWPVQLALLAIFVGASALILGLQYGSRKTVASRGIFAVATICAVGLTLSPSIAGDLSQLVNADRKVATSGPIRLSFDDQSKAEVISKVQQFAGPVIYIPLKVAVDPNRVITVKGAILSIVSADGKLLYSGIISLPSDYPRQQASNILGNTFDAASNGRASNYQAVTLPSELFAKFRNTPGRLSLTYLMNSFAPAATIKATLQLGKPQKIAGVGLCETRLKLDDDQRVDLYCFPATNESKCIAATVLDPAGAPIDPPQANCSTTSTQWGLNTKALTDPAQQVVTFPAENNAGTLHLAITSYKIASVFTQTIVLPHVRLSELTHFARS